MGDNLQLKKPHSDCNGKNNFQFSTLRECIEMYRSDPEEIEIEK